MVQVFWWLIGWLHGTAVLGETNLPYISCGIQQSWSDTVFIYCLLLCVVFVKLRAFCWLEILIKNHVNNNLVEQKSSHVIFNCIKCGYKCVYTRIYVYMSIYVYLCCLKCQFYLIFIWNSVISIIIDFKLLNNNNTSSTNWFVIIKC